MESEAEPAHLPIVSTLNFLVAIQESPEKTQTFQRKYDVSTSEVSSMIRALRPRWDKLVTQTADDMKSWTKSHMEDLLECRKSCDCHFYHEVLEKQPKLKERLSPENRDWLDNVVSRWDHRDRLYCLRQGPSPDPALIEELKKERKAFEAEAAY